MSNGPRHCENLNWKQKCLEVFYWYSQQSSRAGSDFNNHWLSAVQNRKHSPVHVPFDRLDSFLNLRFSDHCHLAELSS